MPTESRANVEKIKKVQDSQGQKASPANEAQQKRVAQSLGNQDSLSAGSYSTGSTNAEQLPSKSIPDGVAVAIQAKTGNAGSVFIGTSNSTPVELTGGDSISFNVSNLDVVYVQTPNSGDSVAYIFES